MATISLKAYKLREQKRPWVIKWPNKPLKLKSRRTRPNFRLERRTVKGGGVETTLHAKHYFINTGFSSWPINSVKPIQHLDSYDVSGPHCLYRDNAVEDWRSGSVTNYGVIISTANGARDATSARALFSAIRNFKDSARNDTQAQLATMLGEGSKSFSMIAKRIGMVIKAYQHLRKGRLYEALVSLEVVPQDLQKNASWTAKNGKVYKPYDMKKSYATTLRVDRNGAVTKGPTYSTYMPVGLPARNRRAIEATQASSLLGRTFGSLSDIWLELNFGWAPLLKDARTALKVTANRVPPFKSEGRGKYTNSEKQGSGHDYTITTAMSKAKVIGYVSVSNPNASTYSQLGLDSNAAAAWDTVPWSFVVDWFIPVSKYLQTLAPLSGVTIKDASSSVRSQVEIERAWVNYQLFKQQGRYDEKWREPGVSSLPNLTDLICDFTKLSSWTAVTTAALSIQQLRKL